MVLSEDKKKEYRKRLLFSRMRILCNHVFYGLLLLHMIYSIDEDCDTAATDGRRDIDIAHAAGLDLGQDEESKTEKGSIPNSV